ncbi:MAG: MarR family winged helix-turn-helix transcriptional regulator [Bacteriovoracia bacterium]
MAKPKHKKTVASVSEFCSLGFSSDTVVHPNLKNYFAYCLYKSAARMKAMLDQALTGEGMVTSQLGILRILEGDGPMSQVELGGSMGIDKATMVKLLDGLESDGLVLRKGSGGDRRVKLIHITASGQAKRKAASRLREKVEKEFLAHLTEAERESLKTILPKLLK